VYLYIDHIRPFSSHNKDLRDGKPITFHLALYNAIDTTTFIVNPRTYALGPYTFAHPRYSFIVLVI
jgi:hypothetical protein